MDFLKPESWPRAPGFSWGVASRGRMVFVAGQVAWDEEERIVGEGDFVAQFGQALRNVVAVVRQAGGVPAPQLPPAQVSSPLQ